MGPLAVAGLAIAGGYLGIVGLMAANESALVFPAPSTSIEVLDAAANSAGATVLTLDTPDGETLYGWRIGDGERLALIFSGNGSSVGLGFGGRYERLVEAGFAVLHVNYRGYPGSSGKPSERGLLIDARSAWDEAQRTHEAEDIVVIGTSLGGGVAVGLVAAPDVMPRALILESTFLSADRAGQEHYPWLPVRLIMRNDFDSAGRASHIDVPTLVVHGDRDRVVPVTHGRRLAELLPNATYVEIPGLGHNRDLLALEPVWPRVLELAGLGPTAPLGSATPGATTESPSVE